MAFFHKASKKEQTREPEEMIKPWAKYLEKNAQKKMYRKPRPVGEVLPNLQRIRHRKLIKNLTILLTPLLILIIGFTYYLSPISQVGQVFVKGTNLIPEQTIINSSTIKPSDHILKLVLSKNKLENNIKKRVPGVKNAQIQITHFNQVTFTITEYQQVGYLNKQNRYYSVLSNGIILSSSVAKPVGNLPVLENFQEGKKLNLLINTYKNLPVSIQNDISEIHLTDSKINPYQVRIFMNDDNEVIADLRTMVHKLPLYPAYAKALNTKGIVDLEVGAFAYPFSNDAKK